MEVRVGTAVLEVVEGDITKEHADAIVHAANSGLRRAGGVDAAIHRAGGPEIMKECRKIGGCPTGGAAITTGGNLKARYVIHAVGPVYRDGRQGEDQLLRNAHVRSMEIASERGLKTVSFPAISTGAYGYPMREAARIALSAVRDYLAAVPGIERVRFVLFGKHAFEVFSEELKKIEAEKLRG
jgi:O-acetyl-ADP-ribose deacetylase (regulator of RNase III)